MANSLQVIALASLVTVVALPVFAAQGQSQRQVPPCLSRKKQAMIGLLLYCSDWDDRYPRAKHWMDAEMPYTKNEQVFKCPEMKSGYGTAFVSSLDKANSVKIADPAMTPVIFDSTTKNRNAFGKLLALLPKIPRHIEGNSIAYSDGHAKMVRVK